MQRDLREAERFADTGAAEDDVLHPGAAQVFRRLFAQNPSDGVGDIALAGSVRPDDCRDARAEMQRRFVREGLEALLFQ